MLAESPEMDSLLNVRLSLVWRRFRVLTTVTVKLFSCTEAFAAFHRLPSLEKLMQAHFCRRCLTDEILKNAFWKEKRDESLTVECKSIKMKFVQG